MLRFCIVKSLGVFTTGVYPASLPRPCQPVDHPQIACQASQITLQLELFLLRAIIFAKAQRIAEINDAAQVYYYHVNIRNRPQRVSSLLCYWFFN
jgi:hypothetical protein